MRAGVAGGVLGTMAVTAGAAPSSSGGQESTPNETTAQLPALDVNLPTATEQAADSLQRSAHQYELDDARDQAADKAADEAQEQKTEAAEARRAEQARQAEQARAERAAERTALSSDAETSAPDEAATGSVAEVLSFLRAQVGKAYVMGASGPNAYDCSSLTQAAFKQAGIDLPRVSQDQSTVGTQISVDQAQPGDLLFWGGVGSAHHVAVYVGNGNYIDAANPEKGVVEQPLSDYPPDSAARVL
ncbi:glycoside hydrolase [Streptomyces oceani]|uniref:Glycoside hydrolase n=2 Tax=Streptomyces oceani TaxID=1075402 RepID=A0A1E7KHA8_9ACTN|nr:glycoside hydrolase [Streptomyces oceani]